MSNHDNQTVKEATSIFDYPKIGDKDAYDREIVEVYFCTRKFYIYQSNERIRYCLPEDYETAANLRKKIFFLTEARSNVERLRRIYGLPKDECERAAAEIAGALAQAFETDTTSDQSIVDAPLKLLRRSEKRLQYLFKSACRKRYIVGAIEAFVCFVVLLVLAMFLIPKLESFGPVETKEVASYAAFSFFGALGAFLSVLLGIRSIDLDINLEWWEHFAAGLTRIGIGVFAGIVIGLAVNSNFLNPDFNANHTESVLLYLLSFVAGFSESLIPNLLKREEESVAGSSSSDENVGRQDGKLPMA